MLVVLGAVEGRGVISKFCMGGVFLWFCDCKCEGEMWFLEMMFVFFIRIVCWGGVILCFGFLG